ncbi:MAG: 30S ribosomal protein S4 [Candidatus Pacearchaeota archaeon]|nr:MAG: 30S ribosomal protein S4 [Candidatus Pacearchaeota archaeon]
MGDPKRQHKKYSRPKTPFDKSRIQEEKAFIRKYGLKNKKEIWRSENYIDRIRSQAKKLILQPEQKETFINRLIRLGLVNKDATIDDILALTKERLFERRLQTVVFKKGIAKTLKGARQLIVHRKIKVGDKIMDVPGYIVRTEEENKISAVKKIKKERPVEEKPKEEVKEEKEEKKEKKEEVK